MDTPEATWHDKSMKKNRDYHGRFIKGHKHSSETIEKNRKWHLGKVAWNKNKNRDYYFWCFQGESYTLE